MDVGSVGGSSSALDQTSANVVKKSQDVEKADGQAAVDLVEESTEGAQQPQSPPPAPGQPGAVLSVYA